jgi:hypothetical protein
VQRTADRLDLIADDQSRSDVGICCGDERLERHFVETRSWPEFHMSHVPAAAFQECCGIRQASAMEESHVDVGAKDADVAKRGVANARGGQAVVHQFSNVGSAAAHTSKPALRQCMQVGWLIGEPGRNRRIAFDSAGEA